jgi:intraflagellar transport protein 52
MVNIFINKDPITLERLMEAACYVFVAPQERFADDELDAMGTYLKKGGSLMFLLAEGGDDRLGTNLNDFLEKYGVVVNADAVVRTVYYKYLHPKEVFISHGVINRGVNAGAGKRPGKDDASSALLAPTADGATASGDVAFVYPYGASLSVSKQAFAVLSTGHISYPLNRPVCALYKHKEAGGKLCVLGSSHIFQDAWFGKEENSKLADVLVKWLLGLDGVTLDPDPDEPDIAEYARGRRGGRLRGAHSPHPVRQQQLSRRQSSATCSNAPDSQPESFIKYSIFSGCRLPASPPPGARAE